MGLNTERKLGGGREYHISHLSCSDRLQPDISSLSGEFLVKSHELNARRISCGSEAWKCYLDGT